MKPMRTKSRGTALVMGLVLAVIVTGLVMTLSWGAGLQSQMTGSLMKTDTVYYAAEAGAQRAAWYIKNGTTVTQPLTGTLNGASYSVTWTTTTGTSQRVTSVGTSGNSQSTVLMTVTPPASMSAAITVGGNFSLKNIRITGDLLVAGNMTFQPGVADVTGNVLYSGTVSGTSCADGTTTQGTVPLLDWTAAQNALTTQAGSNIGTPGTGKTYNFSAIAGTNKVIMVTGDVANPRFVGSGTLYVVGKVTIDGNADPGAANPVNIVCTGDLTTSNNIDYHGNLYTKGDWYRGKIDLTGSLYIQGMDQSNNGNSSITFTSVPWFDNRTPAASSSSTTTFSNFAGPRP